MFLENKGCFDAIKEEENANELGAVDSGGTALPLPGISFSTFIFSLNSSALVQLGILSDPISGKKSIDFVLAKHTINTIEMLKKKTKGNLNSEEAKLILDILYNLKMLYVKLCE